MPYDGNGNYVRAHNWAADAANALDINATEMDQEDNGFAAALSNAVTRDGQGKMGVDFLPNADNTLNLGNGSFRWASINGLPISSIVSGIFYARTAAEIVAGVTPTIFTYPPLNPFRYGADGLNGANDTTAFTRVQSVLAQISAGTPTEANLFSVGYPRTTEELNAQLTTLQSYSYAPDGGNTLNVFRFFTPTQVNAVLGGANTTDVSAAIQAANDFLEGMQAGAIAISGGGSITTGGSGYANGTYTFVPLTGGAGQFAHANVTVSGGAVTAVTITNPGNGYAVSNILSASNANLGGSGSGFQWTVSTLATGRKLKSNGGTLYFPEGFYYCASNGIRVGGNVRWVGSHYEGTTLNWAAGFTGNCITLGPDSSGIYGYSGLYTMGSSVENLSLNLPNGATCGVITTGIAQNSYLRHIRIHNICNTGISITDANGNTSLVMEQLFLFGGAALMSASAVGIHMNYGGITRISDISIEGSGTGTNSGNFLRGIEIIAGQHTIFNYHLENVTTGIDIAATAGEFRQTLMGFTATGAVATGCKGVWIHAGYTGTFTGMDLTAGSGAIVIQNDNTGYARPGLAVVPFYTTAGTATDASILDNAIISGVREIVTYGPTCSIDIGQGSSHLISVTNTTAFTVAAPVHFGNAMPSTLVGRRISLMIRNTGAGVMGAITWNAVFKMSTWTNPANNFSRTIDFEWNGVNWVQVGQTGVDIPN